MGELNIHRFFCLLCNPVFGWPVIYIF